MTESKLTVSVNGKETVRIFADTVRNKFNLIPTKKCADCSGNKVITDFHRCKSHNDGRSSICKVCAREYQKKYRKNNKRMLRRKKREYSLRIKLEGINAYGGKCTCCGEKTKEFLTLDHVNGRRKGRKRLTGRKMWAKAKSEGYPNKYTVLCFNCNCTKGAFGYCPHQEEL